MGDFKEKSFDFANDAIKLILTLATGVLAFTITFLKDMIGDNPIEAMGWLISSWAFMVLTIVGCLWTLFAIVGSADSLSGATTSTASNQTIYSGNIAVPTFMAIGCFVVGMICMVVFTVTNFPEKGNGGKMEQEKADKHICNRDTSILVIQLDSLPKVRSKISVVSKPNQDAVHARRKKECPTGKP